MITLTQKLKKNEQHKKIDQNRTRISVRDKLLTKEVQEMQAVLPNNASLKFSTPDSLHDFIVTIRPSEGFYKGGIFQFSIYVTEEYNMVPPVVKCLTKLWHPNITECGNICLSLLRPHSIDGSGWCPTRRLKDVIWGLDSLFTDLLNFEDPLNLEAATMFQKDKHSFQNKVKDYIELYATFDPK